MPVVKKAKESENSSRVMSAPKKRSCSFCDKELVPSYTDSATLKRFLSDRSRIIPKARTGTCSKHQRELGRQIKYARHLSLLPFVTKVS